MIPTFNRCQLLKRAIESVLAQTYQTIEIVVLDNASTDSTQIYMADLCGKHSAVRYIRHKTNIGAIANWQQIEGHVRGEYFIVLSDDDYLLPTFCETAYTDFQAYPKAKVWYSRFFTSGKEEAYFTVNHCAKSHESRESFVWEYFKGNRNFIINAMVFKTPDRLILTENSNLIDVAAVFNALDEYGIIHSPKILACWTIDKNSWWHGLNYQNRFQATVALHDLIKVNLDKKIEKSFFYQFRFSLYSYYGLSDSFFSFYRFIKLKLSLKEKLIITAYLAKKNIFFFLPTISYQLLKDLRLMFNEKYLSNLNEKQEVDLKNEIEAFFDIAVTDNEKKMLNMVKAISECIGTSLYVRPNGDSICHAVAASYFAYLNTCLSKYSLPVGQLIVEKPISITTEERKRANDFVANIIEKTKGDIDATFFFKRALVCRRHYLKKASQFLGHNDWKQIFN
jgi:glycosyltransferase involved in cell wall biosynthesis